MNLSQKKLLAELAGFIERYNDDAEGVMLYKNGDWFPYEKWNPLEHFDDILRNLSSNQKEKFDNLVEFEVWNVTYVDTYFWFRDNKQKVLDLIVEILEEK